jgi:succinoglycan biosynthesis protein ExoU
MHLKAVSLNQSHQIGEVVDVIIAACNRSDTIGRAIHSAVSQPEVRRVIVVDDGSTDDTAAVAERIAANTGRIDVCRLATNSGPSIARNRAIEISRAPWVSILDADDYFLPGRTRMLVAGATDADLIADGILQIEESHVGSAMPEPIYKFSDDRQHLTFEAFVRGNVSRREALRRELGFLKPIIRRDFLDRFRLRYEETLRLGEDYALYAHALALGARFVIMPRCGYVAVVRENSLSAKHSMLDLERLRDFDLRLAGIATLSNTDRRALRGHYRSVDSRVQWLAVIEGFKSRNAKRFFAPFARSPTMSAFLLRQLLLEAFRRTSIASR